MNDADVLEMVGRVASEREPELIETFGRWVFAREYRFMRHEQPSRDFRSDAVRRAEALGYVRIFGAKNNRHARLTRDGYLNFISKHCALVVMYRMHERECAWPDVTCKCEKMFGGMQEKR